MRNSYLEKNRMILGPFMYVLLSAYGVWQMGLIFFAGNTLSLYGRLPVVIDTTVYIVLMVAGYVSSIILNVFLIKHTVIMSRVAAIAALFCSFMTIMPISALATSVFFYISLFLCVFMIGTSYNIETYLFENKSELKYCLIGAAITFAVIAIIQGDFFVPSFLAFQIISVGLLILLICAYFRMPTTINIQLVPVKHTVQNRSLPILLEIGLLFAVIISTCILVFGVAISETVKYGVGIFYFSGTAAALVSYFMVVQKKLSPFKLITFSFGEAAIGFVFATLSITYPALIYAAIVFTGAGAMSANMCGFFANTVSNFMPNRLVGQFITFVGLIVAVLQLVLLTVLRDSLSLLFGTLSVIGVVATIGFLTFESYLSYQWKKLDNGAKLIENKSEAPADVPPSEETAVIADTEAAAETVAEVHENIPEACRSLSPREREIVGYILSGYGNYEIAGLMYLSENTVKSYRKELYSKLQIHSRRELFALFEKDNTI